MVCVCVCDVHEYSFRVASQTITITIVWLDSKLNFAQALPLIVIALYIVDCV